MEDGFHLVSPTTQAHTQTRDHSIFAAIIALDVVAGQVDQTGKIFFLLVPQVVEVTVNDINIGRSVRLIRTVDPASGEHGLLSVQGENGLKPKPVLKQALQDLLVHILFIRVFDIDIDVVTAGEKERTVFQPVLRISRSAICFTHRRHPPQTRATG